MKRHQVRFVDIAKELSLSKSTVDGAASVNERKGIPIVFLNRICDGMDVSKLIVDDFDSAYCTTEYLIKCKRKCPPWQPVVVEDIGSEVHR